LMLAIIADYFATPALRYADAAAAMMPPLPPMRLIAQIDAAA